MVAELCAYTKTIVLCILNGKLYAIINCISVKLIKKDIAKLPF